MAELFPAVQIDPDPIFICDGNVYTSAGVTAGIDLSLALVEEDWGPELALLVARAHSAGPRVGAAHSPRHPRYVRLEPPRYAQRLGQVRGLRPEIRGAPR